MQFLIMTEALPLLNVGCYQTGAPVKLLPSLAYLPWMRRRIFARNQNPRRQDGK